ncbi:MAG: hypothetical protein ACXQTW_06680 [Candidatus Methanospirareceae archaeon]
MIKASEELNCDDMRVITWDYESDEVEFKGRRIKFIPLWKWLLESKKKPRDFTRLTQKEGKNISGVE